MVVTSSEMYFVFFSSESPSQTPWPFRLSMSRICLSRERKPSGASFIFDGYRLPFFLFFFISRFILSPSFACGNRLLGCPSRRVSFFCVCVCSCILYNFHVCRLLLLVFNIFLLYFCSLYLYSRISLLWSPMYLSYFPCIGFFISILQLCVSARVYTVTLRGFLDPRSTVGVIFFFFFTYLFPAFVGCIRFLILLGALALLPVRPVLVWTYLRSRSERFRKLLPFSLYAAHLFGDVWFLPASHPSVNLTLHFLSLAFASSSF